MSTRNSVLEPPAAVASFDRSGRHLTVYLSGELDAASTSDVADAIARHVRPDDERVWIDMAATTFCDSSGLMMLFALRRDVHEAGGIFVVYSPSRAVRRVIDMCDPSGVLNVRTS